MLKNINNRDNNGEASIESSDRSFWFNHKRQVIKERVTKPKPGPIYAIVRWDTDGTNDLSEGQLCNANGSLISPAALIWVDMAKSETAPQFFGQIVYVVELISLAVSRTGGARDLYRVLSYYGPSSFASTHGEATTARMIGANSGIWRMVDASGTDLSTTINSVVGYNHLTNSIAQAANYNFPDGTILDLARPHIPGKNTNLLFEIKPDSYSRLRTGVNSGIIDAADFVTINIAVEYHKGSEYATCNAVMYMYPNPPSAQSFQVIGTCTSTLINTPTTANAVTSVNFGASSTTSASFIATLGAANPAVKAFNISQGNTALTASPMSFANALKDSGSNVITTLQITYTRNAVTGQFTALSITNTTPAAGWTVNLNYVVIGGRETTIGWPRT